MASASSMPYRLLAKNVVPSAMRACAAAVTSGWAWPTNIGPEPSRKSTYSFPLSSHTRPPRPSRITMSPGKLPKVPPGKTRFARSIIPDWGSDVIVSPPVFVAPHPDPLPACGERVGVRGLLRRVALGFEILLAGRRLDQKAERARRDPHDVAVAKLAGQNLLGKRVLQFALDDPLQRPRTKDRIISGIGEPSFRLCIGLQSDFPLVEQLLQLGQLNVDDAHHVLA